MNKCVYLNLYKYLSIYLSTYLPIYLSTYLPIYLSTYLSIYLWYVLTNAAADVHETYTHDFKYTKQETHTKLVWSSQVHVYAVYIYKHTST